MPVDYVLGSEQIVLAIEADSALGSALADLNVDTAVTPVLGQVRLLLGCEVDSPSQLVLGVYLAYPVVPR